MRWDKLKLHQVQSGEMCRRNMKLREKLIKNKAEKNWDVDKTTEKKQRAKAGERKKYDNLCGLGKGFLKVASWRRVWVRTIFGAVMNEREITQNSLISLPLTELIVDRHESQLPYLDLI